MVLGKGEWLRMTDKYGFGTEAVLIVKEKKNILFTGVGCSFICLLFMILGIVFFLFDTNWAVFVLVETVFGMFLLLSLYILIAYLFHRLTVYTDGTLSYRGYLGRTVYFTLYEVGQIEERVSLGSPTLFLRGKSGQTLARLENNMENYEAFVQWLQSREQHVKKHGVQPVQERVMQEPTGKLTVTCGKSRWIIDLVILLLYVRFGLYYALNIILITPMTGYQRMIALVILLWVLLAIVRSMIIQIRANRSLLLVLTPSQCSYTDYRGRKKEFMFYEIGSSEVKRALKHAYIVIKDRNGEVLVKMSDEFPLRNKDKIIPFVTYYQEYKEETMN